MKWREVYQPPFRIDSNSINYVWANNGTMTMTFSLPNEHKDKQTFIDNVVKKLNGDTSVKFDRVFTLRNNIYFHYGGLFAFSVRGWGELIGSGGFKLPADEAAKVQDEFSKWVLEILNS